MKELSDEKRMLLAFVLMIAILGIWSKFYKPPVAPPKQAPAITATTTAGTAPAATAGTAPAATASTAGDATTK